MLLVIFSCVFLCSGRRLKCGPVGTTLNTSSTTTDESLSSADSEDTSASTVVSTENVCQLCGLGQTDSILNDFKQMFDNQAGPSDCVCADSTEKLSVPGFPFGYSYEMGCCYPQAPPIDCSLPGQTICPPTPGMGLSESLASYISRLDSILVDAPANGCCNFGTFQARYLKGFMGLQRDICTCLDFTKIIDFSV